MMQYPTRPNCPGSSNRARITVVAKLRSFPETKARYVHSDPWMASSEKFTVGSPGMSDRDDGMGFTVTAGPREIWKLSLAGINAQTTLSGRALVSRPPLSL